MSVVDLSRPYACKIGGPVLKAVDRRIFALRYYMDCMGCNFCHDTCCQYGVDVDLENVALNTGGDYHDLKPLVSILFPLTFEYGVLEPSSEIQDGSVICYGEGPTVYEGSRDELLYYFGAQMVAELDALRDG